MACGVNVGLSCSLCDCFRRQQVESPSDGKSILCNQLSAGCPLWWTNNAEMVSIGQSLYSFSPLKFIASIHWPVIVVEAGILQMVVVVAGLMRFCTVCTGRRLRQADLIQQLLARSLETIEKEQHLSLASRGQESQLCCHFSHRTLEVSFFWFQPLERLQTVILGFSTREVLIILESVIRKMEVVWPRKRSEEVDLC